MDVVDAAAERRRTRRLRAMLRHERMTVALVFWPSVVLSPHGASRRAPDAAAHRAMNEYVAPFDPQFQFHRQGRCIHLRGTKLGGRGCWWSWRDCSDGRVVGDRYKLLQRRH